MHKKSRIRYNNNFSIYFPVLISFLFAFCVTIIPINPTLKWLRPDLVTLLMIYWVANLPNNIGVVFAFFIGILFDLLSGTLLGSMGLTLSIVAFLTMNLRLRLRIYRTWQKCVIVMLLLACSQLIRLWIQMLIGHPPASFFYWISSFTTAFLWPIISIILNSYHRSSKLAI
jgi:rod shape-determining protein MreD